MRGTRTHAHENVICRSELPLARIESVQPPGDLTVAPTDPGYGPFRYFRSGSMYQELLS